MNFGGKHLQDKVVKDCLQGKKFICLAITEPYAGSDVAGLRTTAVKDPSGKFYVVNGEKKWCVRLNSESQHRLPADRDACLLRRITNGVFCDYFTVAVRTGGEGAGGISLLLLERGMKGLETKQMKVSAHAVRLVAQRPAPDSLTPSPAAVHGRVAQWHHVHYHGGCACAGGEPDWC